MTAGRWRGWLHLALAAAGGYAVLWALVLGADPTIWCREQAMRPGEVCANAQGTKIQTYEERYSAAQWARPVVGGVGVAVGAFALVLWRGSRRTSQSTA